MILNVGSTRLEVDERELSTYLTGLYGRPVKVLKVEKLGEGFHNAGFRLSIQVGTDEKRIVVRVVRGDTGWGHDYPSDRAAVLLLQHRLFNAAPRTSSPPSIDVAAVHSDGHITTVGSCVEFLHLVEEVTVKDGRPYSEDLFEVARRKSLTDKDRRRCLNAAQYLADLHGEKAENEHLYRRHIRDLVGHGEMLMGVADSYPDPAGLDWTTRAEMAEVEVKAVEWRNRLKYLKRRPCRIHGDFHPFGNIRFKEDDTLVALDQSREEFGEAADDVSTLTINYIFFSVWHLGDFAQPFEELFHTFLREYLDRTGDHDILGVLPPYYAFRGLVVAHPVYYPDMEHAKRRMMMNLVRNVLDSKAFEPMSVKSYLMNSPKELETRLQATAVKHP